MVTLEDPIHASHLAILEKLDANHQELLAALERQAIRILGRCPAPADGSADITSLYTARYGGPPAAKKVYVRAKQVVDGWESLPTTYWAIVPTSA